MRLFDFALMIDGLLTGTCECCKGGDFGHNRKYVGINDDYIAVKCECGAIMETEFKHDVQI